MRLYYASDVHGSERLWRKFLNAPSFYDVEVLVMGGDVTGKVMVTLVEEKPGRWVANVLGREQTAKGEQKAAELERRIRLNGFYPLRVPPEEMARLEADEAHRDRVFRELMGSELRRWLALADEKLAGTGVRCFLMAGNDDEWDVDPVLDAAAEPVVHAGERVVAFDGVQMLSSLGRTLCINPGSAYGEGVIDGAIVEIADGRIVSHQLVSG